MIKTALIIILQPKTVSTSQSIGLFLLRFVAGLAFMYHGWGKIQQPFEWMGPDSPMPGFLQALAAVAEFGGGLAWIVGLLTPIASLGLFCTMIVAVRLHMLVLGHPFVAEKPGEMSYELAALYLVISALFLLTGPGKISLDHLLFRKK